MSSVPQTAREILQSLPNRVREGKLPNDVETTFHFRLDGDTGGDFTVNVQNGNVEVFEGIVGEAACEIKAKAKDYEAIELGKTNPQMAFMMGKVKVSNLAELMKFVTYFQRLY